MQAAGMTHQGHLRARNEDAYWFDERRGFLAIADGLGGHGFGHLASQKAIDFVTRMFSPEAFIGMTRHSPLVQAVNRHIYQLSQDHPGADGMRSTLACLHWRDAVFNCAWLGDSRIYLGTSIESLQCVSDDHTLFAQKKRQGIRPQPEDKHLLTRSIGGPFEVNVGTRQIRCSRAASIVPCSPLTAYTCGDAPRNERDSLSRYFVSRNLRAIDSCRVKTRRTR